VNLSHAQHILVVRTDRIGDVVLTLPMIPVLRANFPSARIAMLLRSYTKELAEGHPGLDEILLYDEQGTLKPFRALWLELRRSRFDLVILASPTFRLALLMLLAGIPVRVGTGYRWYSLLFNRRVYEHRKTAERHELEYNFSLLKRIGISVDRYEKPQLVLAAHHVQAAEHIRQELGLDAGARVVVLHPGSGGSARDWSPLRFAQLGRELAQKGYRVVVTGGPGEDELVEQVVKHAGIGVLPLVNRLSVKELAAFLRMVDLFVSNSTGPLHIAAAVGTPVIGFYPPIRACSPQRWGPYTDLKTVFVPDPKACPRCHGKPCQGNDCMDLISVQEVVQCVERMLHTGRSQPVEVRL
jgi:heptosyltransferase-3